MKWTSHLAQGWTKIPGAQHGVHKIKYLLADREFMSKEWLDFLTKKQIKFAIPLRKDMKIRIARALQIRQLGKSFDYFKTLV